MKSRGMGDASHRGPPTSLPDVQQCRDLHLFQALEEVEEGKLNPSLCTKKSMDPHLMKSASRVLCSIEQLKKCEWHFITAFITMETRTNCPSFERNTY